MRPAGRAVGWAGRPVDLALSPDAHTLYAKDNRGLVAIDVATWAVRQELPFGKAHGGGSMHGLVVRRVYATTAWQALAEAEVGGDGRLTYRRMIPLPGPKGEKAPWHPCGIALAALPVCSEPTSRVYGTVLYNGKPLAGATVVLMPPNNRAYPAVTDNDGNYEIVGVGRGTVRVAV